MSARRVFLAAAPDERRTLIAEAFRAAGWLVTEVAHGGVALSLIRTERPQLALLQAILPRLDGIEILRCLKADPLTRDILVALLIGHPPDVGSFPAVSAAGEVFETVADFVVIPSLVEEFRQLSRLVGEAR